MQKKTIDEEKGKAVQLTIAYLDKNGHEVVSSIPLAPPLAFKRRPTIFDHNRELIAQFHREQADREIETLLDADDFEIPDDPDFLPDSKWENNRDPSLSELVQEGMASIAARRKAAEEAADRHDEQLLADARPASPRPPAGQRKAEKPAPEE